MLHPSLRAFWPLFYVAWADGDLTGAEIRVIRSVLERRSDLDPQALEVAAAWLDPESPPTASLLLRLREEMVHAATDMPANERRSLASLGGRMAEVAALDADGTAVHRDAVALAVREIMDALGVDEAEVAAAALQEARPTAAAPATAPATVDVAGLRAFLDGEDAAALDRIRGLLDDGVLTRQPGLHTAAYREQVLEWLQLLADRGLGGLAWPTVAGDDADAGAFMATFEGLAAFDMSLVVKYGVQFGLFGGAIFFLGRERHHRELLPRVASLELPGCFAMSEFGHGSNVRDLETTATWDPDRGVFVLHTPSPSARKEWIGNAACHGRMAVVFAQLVVRGHRHGVHALLVPIRGEDGQPCPGVSIRDCGEKMGLHGVDNGRLWFDHVDVPRENLLNRFADVTPDGDYISTIPGAGKRFFTTIGTLVGGRISVARAGLMAARTGLAIAIRYGEQRRQFGAPGEPEMPILDYRMHQRRLMPLLARTVALVHASRTVTRQYIESDESTGRQELEAMAAGLKAMATAHTRETLFTCRECCGGQGYLAENRLADLIADTEVFTTFEGDNTVLWQLVARSRLSDWQRTFQGFDAFGLLRHFAERAGASLASMRPTLAQKNDGETLRDPELALTLLRHREQSLLASVARRMKSRIDDGMEPFHALNDCQDHLVAAGEAWMERLVAERFAEAVAAAGDATVRDTLTSVQALFGLHAVEQRAGWLLENGFIDGARARAVRTEVNTLCAEVRAIAPGIVDAFALPAVALDAPIACSNFIARAGGEG
ncbi:MAG: acyl-CoA oxidase [Deltaproteobacteria bacterium]|nr:MAG: acyl-CoA oxidase [Deltaproteobacteria bacterium]